MEESQASLYCIGITCTHLIQDDFGDAEFVDMTRTGPPGMSYLLSRRLKQVATRMCGQIAGNRRFDVYAFSHLASKVILVEPGEIVKSVFDECQKFAIALTIPSQRDLRYKGKGLDHLCQGVSGTQETAWKGA